jgi:hypothetical protein
MTQPHNLARDMFGLPTGALEGFQYWDRRYPNDQHSIKYTSSGASHPLERHHHPLQRWDRTAPGKTYSKNLSGQVKPSPHITDSKNILECRPP